MSWLRTHPLMLCWESLGCVWPWLFWHLSWVACCWLGFADPTMVYRRREFVLWIQWRRHTQLLGFAWPFWFRTSSSWDSCSAAASDSGNQRDASSTVPRRVPCSWQSHRSCFSASFSTVSPWWKTHIWRRQHWTPRSAPFWAWLSLYFSQGVAQTCCWCCWFTGHVGSLSIVYFSSWETAVKVHGTRSPAETSLLRTLRSQTLCRT